MRSQYATQILCDNGHSFIRFLPVVSPKNIQMRPFQYLSILGLVAVFSLVVSCQTTSQNSTQPLDAATFQSTLAETGNAQLLDVRTPEEFDKGHLARAQNADWNDAAFEQQLGGVLKDKPVFVYCLSGGRSASAAKRLRKLGYTQVYDLKGGILAWQNASFPVENAGNVTETGLTLAAYEAELIADVPVLVNFYAPWCGPCKKMAPMLKALTEEESDAFKFVKLNADDHKALMKQLDVNEIPTLLIYQNGVLAWKHVGLVERATLVQELGL